MPRGRPKGSKNKSSRSTGPTSSRSRGPASATQLASLVKARAVRAKQIKYFPALPQGGFKALSTPARMSARAKAYSKFTKKMLSGTNKRVPTIAYGSISTAYPISYATGLSLKARKPRVSKPKTSVAAAVSQVVSAVKKVKKAATATQLAALEKARAARNANRGDYVALPKGGYKALTTVARKNAKAAAYAAMADAYLSGGNTAIARRPYGTLVDNLIEL